MTPLFSPCTKCGHPAIKAAKQCKQAMELSNAKRHHEAEAILRTALVGLRQSPLPMMRAKLLNSLGLVYAQQNDRGRANRCFISSLRIVEKHVGADNWLYTRIAGNRAQLFC